MKVMVLAKSPIAGAVKTRLCPPLDFAEAAAVAEAALHDTLVAVAASGANQRLLILDGEPGPWLPAGFRVIPQRGSTLVERLTAAWQDAGGPALQIGMDTPQVDASILDSAMSTLDQSPRGAVLGLAEDGGWWAIGLMTGDRRVFRGVPMSTPHTGAAQRASLIRLARDPVLLPALRDVDTWEDARHIADSHPSGRFSQQVRQLVNRPSSATAPGGCS